MSDTPIERGPTLKRVHASVREESALAAHIAFHSGHPCLSGVFRVVNQRRG